MDARAAPWRGRVLRLADALSLAAAPGFGAMALLEGWQSPPAALCTPAGASHGGGMAIMYLLMSVAHLPVLLRTLCRRTG